MRDLDATNSATENTKQAFTITLIIPLLMGWGAWALACGAAPKVPLVSKYLAMLGLGTIFLAIIALPIPYLFKWNWEVKYFGAGIFPFSTASILGIYPVACITRYSSLPWIVRVTFATFETVLVIWWCSRFVKLYEYIYHNKSLFSYIYKEEKEEVYYLQQADKEVIQKILKFDQFPSTKFTIPPMLLAFSLAPFAGTVSHFTGLPFIHIFLAVGATPVNLMLLGLCTRGWLIFYYYPEKIKKETNKRVYVDKFSQPTEHIPGER